MAGVPLRRAGQSGGNHIVGNGASRSAVLSYIGTDALLGKRVPLPSGGDDYAMLAPYFALPNELIFPYSPTPWLVSQPLIMSTAGKRIRGAGPDGSQIQATFSTEQNAIVSINPQTGGSSNARCSIKSMGFIGNANTDNCVFLGASSYQWNIEHCFMTGATGANNGQGGNGIGMAGPGASGAGDTNTGQKYSGRVARCVIIGNGTGIQVRERSQWLNINHCAIYNNSNWGVDAWRDQTTVAGGKLFITGCDIESNGTGTVPKPSTHSYPSGNVRLLGVRVAIIRDVYMELSTPYMGVNVLIGLDAASNMPEVVKIDGGYLLGDNNAPFGVVATSVRDLTLDSVYFGSYAAATDGDGNAGREVLMDPASDNQIIGYRRVGCNVDDKSDSITTVADAAYTTVDADQFVEYTTLTAPRLVTLITPAGRSGRTVTVKDGTGLAAVGNAINIATVSGRKIDGFNSTGATAVSITTAWGFATFRSNGARWEQIG